MRNKLIPFAIASLALMNVLTFIYSSRTTSELTSLRESVEKNTNKVVYVQAEDGYTPIKDIDYFDGKDGQNSMSYAYTTTVMKEVPLMGTEGKPGRDGKDGIDGKDGENAPPAPLQQLQVNATSGDIESKLSTDVFWSTFVQCVDYRLTCPGDQ